MNALEQKNSAAPARTIADLKIGKIGSEERRLLASYASFMAIAHGEAHHLGRMVSDERLKGFISTTRSFYVASDFATDTGKRRRLGVHHSGPRRLESAKG